MWSYDGNIVGLLEKSLQPVTHKPVTYYLYRGQNLQRLFFKLEVTAKLVAHTIVKLCQHNIGNIVVLVPIASHANRLSPIICTWLKSPKAALHAGSYCKLVAQTVVELWQHKIGIIIRITENRPTSSPHSLACEWVVTHYLYMVRISKGCSSCWKLLQTCSSYRCGVMAVQNWQYHQNHRKSSNFKSSQLQN